MSRVIVKKITVLSLLMMFLVQPILSVLLGIGSVEAASTERYIYTNTTRDEEINAQIGANEKATLIQTEYKYSVYYQKTINLWVFPEDINLFYQGRTLGCNSDDNLKFSIKSVTQHQTEKKWAIKYYSYGWYEQTQLAIVVEGTYRTNWSTYMKGKSDFPSMTVSYSSSRYNINETVNPHANTNISEYKRYKWKVTAKSNDNLLDGLDDKFLDIVEKTGELLNNPSIENSDNDTDANSGSTNSGSTNSGSTNSGSTNSGSTSSGSTNSGSTNSGSTNSGSASTGNSNTSVNNQIVTEQNVSMTQDQKRLWIKTLYKRVLNENATDGQINQFLDNTAHEITRAIITSERSKTKNSINNMTEEQYVKACYRWILGREADATGLTNQTKLLKATSKENVINKLVNAEGFKNQVVKETTRIKIPNDQTREAVFHALWSNNTNSIVNLENKEILMYKNDVAKVTNLDLAGYGLTGLSGLENFTNLEILYLNNNKLTTFNEIKKLTNLKTLHINNNDFTSLSDLASLTKLENLYANNNTKLTSINGIEKLTSLKQLYLNNSLHNSNMNTSQAILKISNLTNLEALSLESNNIKSLYIDGRIENLKKLKRLYLNSNSISTFASIAKLSNLELLYIDNNAIRNISGITNLKKLTSFSIKNNTSSFNISGSEVSLPDILQKVNNKNSLVYSANSLKCTNCKISGNKVTLNANAKTATIEVTNGKAKGTKITITNIAKTIQVKDKVLADRLQSQLGSKITSRAYANGNYVLYINQNDLNAVRTLNLAATDTDAAKITDITGLDVFANVTNIDLSNNAVKNLRVLEDLDNLRTLVIKNNGLKNLSLVGTLTQITSLDASNNEITDIMVLSDLENLQRVILSNNHIGNNLQALANLTNLKTLAISNNQVSDVSCLSKLKLTRFHSSYNNVSDYSAINKENIETFDIKNNKSISNSTSTTVEMPEIIATAIKKGGSDSVECTNCSIVGGKIVLNTGSKVGKVTIKTGTSSYNSSDSSVTINSTGDITPPQVTVSYKKNAETGKTDVIITSNEKIARLAGFEPNEDRTVWTRSYGYNIRQNVKLYDYSLNTTTKLIEINDMENEAVPGLKVSYSDNIDEPTNQPVTITVTADEPIMIMNVNMGWVSSEDEKTLTYTKDSNVEGGAYIVTKRSYNEAAASGNGNVIGENIEYRIYNIDKKAPTCEVEYGTGTLATGTAIKSSALATIWSNEEIKLKDNSDIFTQAVTKTDENGKIKYGINLYFDENVEKTITVEDLAGNTSTANIKIDNIDKMVKGLYVTPGSTSVTNQPVTVEVNADENITLVNTTMPTASIKSESDIYVGGINVTKIATILRDIPVNKEILYTVAGDTNVLPIMDGDTELVKSSPIAHLNGAKMLLAEGGTTVDNSTVKSNYLEYNLTENSVGTVEVQDEAGNTDVALYSVDTIDTTAPQIQQGVEQNEDGSVTVTLYADELIATSDELAGWELGEDGTMISKVFTVNKTETLQVSDLAGNTTEFEVVVDSIEENINYTLNYEQIEGTDKILVVIQSDTQLKEVGGWELSKDGTALGILLTAGDIKNITIEDYNGNHEEVAIDLSEFVQEDTNEEDKGNTEDNKEDNTQADKDIPQTGIYTKYILISGSIIAILTMLTITVLWMDRKEFEEE